MKFKAFYYCISLSAMLICIYTLIMINFFGKFCWIENNNFIRNGEIITLVIGIVLNIYYLIKLPFENNKLLQE